MKRYSSLWYLAAAAILLTPVGLRMLSWPGSAHPEASQAMADAGKVLFTHEWTPNDPLARGGDGLGPVYNATSCAVCHRQGGLGGGGGREHNVTAFLVLTEGRGGGEKREGVLHAHATSAQLQETLKQVHPELPAIARPGLAALLPEMGGKVLQLPGEVRLSQRNTPALFGAGLIDGIPDRVIIAEERRQRVRHGLAPTGSETTPAGRALRLADSRVGKFGWKAQSPGLAEFVRAACANELGLGNPGNLQPAPLGKPDYRPAGLDLTSEQCDQMTAFVAALPRPGQKLPADARGRARVAEGQKLFASIGCAACHTPDLGSVEGLYSDLLLHRMGDKLEASGGSYGAIVVESAPSSSSAGPDEWRTPPLWGVADSAPYMHDGRAATLEEAIRLHGGQGAAAARRFGRLAPGEQGRLIDFLKSLRAP
jgi:CxxC motif-containing protein (DUF1111 family)